MRMMILGGFTLLCASVATSASAQPRDLPKTTEQLIVEARGRLNGLVETKGFEDKIPFAKFLQKLQGEISKDKPLAIEFDRAAFGKDADKMLKTEVSLPMHPSRMNCSVALRLALSQVPFEKHLIEFSARPGTLVITTRDRAMFTMTYEIGDLLKHTPYLHEIFRGDEYHRGVFFLVGPDAVGLDAKADPSKPDEWLVRQIMTCGDAERARWRDTKLPSTLRVHNGTKVVVHTAPSVHAEIDQLLATLRRLADLFVVLDAKVYALDRDEYEAHFASHFLDPKDKSVRRLAATVTEAQWKRLQGRKPILASDDDKLRPYERGMFLSRKVAYQYQAHPGDADPAIAFEGFSFAVRPLVSADRRCLKLEFTHDVEQLVKITKGMMLDPKTDKEAPVDLPNLRKSARVGAIEIHDGQPIMLAVDYQPKDTVWLVLAAPRIYMEEEEEHIRKASIKRMPLADEKPAPPEMPENVVEPPVDAGTLPAVELPNTVEMKELLQAILLRVMTDPKLKECRDLYSTDRTFALIDGSNLRWPKRFRPDIPDYQRRIPESSENCFYFKPRLLALHVDSYFRERNPKDDREERHVWLHISNVGGGTWVRPQLIECVAYRRGDEWVIRCEVHPENHP